MSAKKIVGSTSTSKAKTNESFKIVPRGVNKRHICCFSTRFFRTSGNKIGIRRDEKIRF